MAMSNIFIIARKELLSTFRQRNMMLIMFLSPIVLVMIMGLAFGGFGGSGGSAFTDMPIAVVNLDQGFDLQAQFPVSATGVSLDDLELEIGGQTLNLGEQLLQNEHLAFQATEAAPGDFSMNMGNQLAGTLTASLTPLLASTFGWSTSFITAAVICFLGGLAWLLVDPAEPLTEQPRK